MIYCIPPSAYPKEGQAIEEIVYKDENEFEWRIARVVNGFIVRYFGPPYFKENLFICELQSGETFFVKNTNCIFFKTTDFETFCDVRDVIKSGYTDDIWSAMQEFFMERFEHDKGMLESEILA